MESRTPLVATAAALVALCACCSKAPAPAPAPGAAPSADAGGAPPAATDVVPDDMPRFLPPEGWVTEAVARPMRLHQYRLPGTDGALDVEVVVASWPQGIGPREENLQRWAGQVGADGVDPARRTARDVRGFAVTTVHLEGPYTPDGGEGGAGHTVLLASWIEAPGRPHVWTVKATGPAVTIERWRDSYEAFIAGL